jgi:hypothetical protein
MDENTGDMNTPSKPTPPRTHGRLWAGLFLLLVGGVLLLEQFGFPLPDWLFTWQMLLIAIGFFVGLRHNFRGGGWMIPILIGGYFLMRDHYPEFPLNRFLWPGILIFVGLMIILAPRKRWWNDDMHRDWHREWRRQWKEHRHKYGHSQGPTVFSGGQTYSSGEDFIDSTAIFGGVHKKIVSKNFKGGDVTSIMGGTELDLSQADFTGVARLDITQIMGGTKIIVPAHWEVRSEVTALFAGYEDKRQQPAVSNPDKVLLLVGTSLFAGVELRNF